MLSRPGDFARLAEEGVSRTHPLLVGRFVRTNLDQTRFGLATGKRLGGAVTRNRVRRRLKEAVRVHAADDMAAGHDYVIVGREDALAAPFVQIKAELSRRLRGR